MFESLGKGCSTSTYVGGCCGLRCKLYRLAIVGLLIDLSNEVSPVDTQYASTARAFIE